MGMIETVLSMFREAAQRTGKGKLPGGHKSNDRALTLSDLSSEEAGVGARMFEVADERVVAAELSGRMDLGRFFVYAFKGKDQKDVVGMGIKGTQTLFRKLYKAGPSVAEGFPQYAEDTLKLTFAGSTQEVRRVRCQTVIVNPLTKERTPGVSTADNYTWIWDREWRNGKSYKKDTGRWEEDRFYYQKALTKATRNAMQGQIDPIQLIDWMFRWLKEKRVWQLEQDESRAMVAGGAVGVNRLDMFRKRIFNILSGGGLDMSGEDTPDKKAFHAWMLKWHKRTVSQITEPDEMRAVGNMLQDTQIHYGEKFADHIRQGGSPVVPFTGEGR